jgi:hypothetical protein
MSRCVIPAVLAALLIPAISVAAEPKDELQAAVKKLAEAPNYRWTTKFDGGFARGPGDGRTEKNGASAFSLKFGDDSYSVIVRGEKGAAKGLGGWASTAELVRDAEEETGFSPERFIAMTIQSFKTPAGQAEDMCKDAVSVQKSGDVYSAVLNDEIVKRLLSFMRRRGADANGAQIEVKEPKGTARFWVSDGLLSKMEVHLQGTVVFNGNARNIDRTTTTEIKDIGSTKVEVPDGAKAKL